MSENERLLTRNEITECYRRTTFPVPSAVEKQICLAQDAKTYPLAFEAGKKEGEEERKKQFNEQSQAYNELLSEYKKLQAQAEKEKQEIKQSNANYAQLQKWADSQLAEAEKRGAREFTSWFGSLLDSCLSYVPDAGDRGKIIEVWQAKLKSLEER